jgi:hypothetical protein
VTDAPAPCYIADWIGTPELFDSRTANGDVGDITSILPTDGSGDTVSLTFDPRDGSLHTFAIAMPDPIPSYLTMYWRPALLNRGDVFPPPPNPFDPGLSSGLGVVTILFANRLVGESTAGTTGARTGFGLTGYIFSDYPLTTITTTIPGGSTHWFLSAKAPAREMASSTGTAIEDQQTGEGNLHIDFFCTDPIVDLGYSFYGNLPISGWEFNGQLVGRPASVRARMIS